MITSPYDISINEDILNKHSYQEISDARKPYYFQRNVFSPEECETIWNLWNEDECFVEDNVTVDSPWFKYFREERSRKHMFLDDNVDWLDAKMTKLINRINAENFFLDISFGLMSKQLMYYRPGDWFQPHDDTNHWDNNYFDRKITAIVQLSDHNDYEGGETILGEPDELAQPKHQREQGSLLVFPTFLIHGVNKIISGYRKGFICWFSGPKLR